MMRWRSSRSPCCPISNRYVTGSLKAEQIKQLIDRGIRVTVNSDDPAYFPGYVTDNLLAVHEAVGLSVAEVVGLQTGQNQIGTAPTAETPDISLNGSANVGAFLAANAAPINSGSLSSESL